MGDAKRWKLKPMVVSLAGLLIIFLIAFACSISEIINNWIVVFQDN